MSPGPRGGGRRAARIAVLASSLLAGCAGVATGPGERTARAELRDAGGRIVGTATFAQVGPTVRLVVEAQGLPPGVKAVHVHAIGRCEGPSFTSAGPHFNPYGKQHGALNPAGPHAGDLPNLRIDADGRGRLETATELISLGGGAASLFDADGSAVVIHAAPDDFRTDPTGNAGARLACGVITRS